MDEQKKKILIKEIRHWKAHKLLPEHYCDFLLALYTEGANSPETLKKSSSSFIFYFYIYSVLLLIPTTFLVTYFTELSFALQMTLYILFLCVSFLGVLYLYHKKRRSYQIPLISGIVILLFVSLHVMITVYPLNNMALIIVILLNTFFWVFLGVKIKLHYLSISGSIGAIILIFYYFQL